MSANANWPIRIGGIYLLTGREPLALRVRALDGETVHYIHVEGEQEFGIGEMHDAGFRALCQPEDQSPLPELLEALEDLLEALPKQTDDADWWPDELTHAVRAARAAIAKAEASR